VREQRQRLRQRLAVIRQRLDQMYLDKLDGKIDAEFWERKSAEWRAEEQQVTMKLAGLDQASPDRLLNASRILELANKARFLYVSQNPAEKAKLLKMVLSNCTLDRATLYPTYRKPFDLIFHRAKNEEWRRGRDSIFAICAARWHETTSALSALFCARLACTSVRVRGHPSRIRCITGAGCPSPGPQRGDQRLCSHCSSRRGSNLSSEELNRMCGSTPASHFR
jgi:DNA polymerase III psi subunit